MKKIYRWHISRIIEDSVNNNSRLIWVTITPFDGDIPGEDTFFDPGNLVRAQKDQLSWWSNEKDQRLEGLTTEKALIKSVIKKNALKKLKNSPIPPEKRKLTEDMVFLQFVPDKNAWDQARKKMKDQKDPSNLAPIVKLKEATWLDFTRQAREMSKDIYQKVLGEQKEAISHEAK